MTEDAIANTKAGAPWPRITNDNIGFNYGNGKRIKVICTAPQGVYYNHRRRREGDVFELIPMWVTIVNPKNSEPVDERQEELAKEIAGKKKIHVNEGFYRMLISADDQFSPKTMKKVEDETPLSKTTAQQALDGEQSKLNEAKIPVNP